MILSKIFGIRLRNLKESEKRKFSAQINYDLEQLFIKMDQDENSLESIVSVNNASEIYNKILNDWRNKKNSIRTSNYENLDKELERIIHIKHLKEIIGICDKKNKIAIKKTGY